MSKPAKLQPPNYTQIPNALFALMPSMSLAELKCMLAIARETFGWHRERQQISLSRLMFLTGLSRQGVTNGIKDGMERGVIVRNNEGQNFSYGLSIEESTSQVSRPVKKVDQSSKLTTTSQVSRPELVKEVDQPIKEYKETLKETTKEKGESADAPARAAGVGGGVDVGTGQDPRKGVDPLLEDPGVITFKSVHKCLPTAGVPREQIAHTVTDLELWVRVLEAWSLRGHNKTNVEGQLDWYRDGIPVHRGGTRNVSERIVGEAKPIPNKYAGIEKRRIEKRVVGERLDRPEPS